jgi:hypothetical protein
MLTTKRLLLGLIVLGVVGMHGLVTSSSTTAAHHGWVAASATTSVHDHASVEMASHDTGKEGDESTALALCMALLLAFGVVTLAVRRSTWVADVTTHVARIPLPVPPVLRDRSPVPRFTVMRC